MCQKKLTDNVLVLLKVAVYFMMVSLGLGLWAYDIYTDSTVLSLFVSLMCKLDQVRCLI